MADQTTTDEPTVTDIRRALMAEAADFHRRCQPHRHAMKIDGYGDVALDAYEGLATAGAFVQLVSAILADLADNGHEELAVRYTAWTHDVMENGDDGLEDANSDIPWGGASESEDAADLALVQARAVTDNGNRTSLAEVLSEFDMNEADTEVEG
jgi:hypothetical protein